MRKLLFCCTAALLAATTATAGTNLAPMLEAGVTVPNGGILRLFPKVTMKGKTQKELVKTFAESPYKDVQPLRNMRYTWNRLERGKGEYLFDKELEPLFVQCVKEHSRVTPGLAWMCGGGYPSAPLRDGQRCTVPEYLYRELAASNHPMMKDASYGGGLTPDYDSPLLLERFRALLNAFSAWLDGNVTGTQIKRRDVVYGIEMRYFGYWGEGAVKNGSYPVTDVFDGYIDAYLSAFPDILLIAPMQETLHLPTRKNYDAHPTNPQYLRAMKHVGRLFRERNAAGRLGFFIDCWEHKTHTVDNPKVMFDGDGNVISMAQYRAANTWGDSYITGEFAYFIRKYSKNLVPYAALADQFRERHVSGISLHNFTIIDTLNGKPDPSLGNRPRTYVTPSPEIYASLVRELQHLPRRIQQAIDMNYQLPNVASHYASQSLFFIGRNTDYAVALEGALKMKEISYLHAESYAAGELKHGTIALIEENQPVIAVCCNEALADKTLSNIVEVKARGAKVLALAFKGNKKIVSQADDVIFIPRTETIFSACLAVVPLQLLAYYAAKEKGCDIDKPKNLAKSVTVE